ncbi:hypothetical protein Q9L58_001271 [Maublancomyces gigas]|uniref:Uncharacterized protein n=1 Tax=Discina gigas TaxID=1032678 RepID=A0ABR3GUW3_9PEZI
MKFSTIIMTVGFAAFAVAQSTTSTSTAPVRTSSYTDAQASCLGSCAETDVSCRAECLGNPAPDAAAVDATNKCAAACPQGSGSAEDTQKYSDCQQSCISSNFFTTTRVGSQGGSPSATPTGSHSGSSSSGGPAPTGSSSGADSSGSGSDSGSPTETSSAAAQSSNAAGNLAVGGSFAGLFAMAAGILVL